MDLHVAAVLSKLFESIIRFYLADFSIQKTFPYYKINIETSDEEENGHLRLFSSEGILTFQTVDEACKITIMATGESAQKAMPIFEELIKKTFPVVF